jgi:ankyrin repeat protein
MKLHSAAEKNDVKTLKELLDGGMPVDKRDPTGDTALLAAARDGKEKAFFFLLDAGADPKAVGYAKESVLHRAASAGKEKMVQALLDRGADPNLLCSYPDMIELQPGMTPFHSALFNDHFAVAELLLKHGADINAKLEDGRTALELVEDLEDRKLSKWLRAHGAVPNPQKEALKGETTDLHRAAKKGEVDKIKKLLAAGRAVDERDPTGQTALMFAAANNRLDAFRELLQAKADPNAVDLKGQSVFQHMAQADSSAMVRAWIDAGGNVNQETMGRSGLRPLMVAAMAQNVDSVRMLLAAGADVKAKDGEGNTVFKWAKLNPSAEINDLLKSAREGQTITAEPVAAVTAHGFLKAVLKDHVDVIRAWAAGKNPVDVRQEEGMTALALAGQNEKWKSFQELLAAGADPNAVDHHELTPLFWAAQDEKAVKALIAAGADVNYQTARQRVTPLMRACKVDRLESAKAMLDAGADPLAKDVGGQTALDRAKEHSNQNLAKLMRAAMPNAKKKAASTDPKSLGRRLNDAVVDGKVDEIKAALQAGAAVDFRDLHQATPLMLAAIHQKPEAFDALLGAGADPHAVGPRGNSVLYLAAYAGQLPIVQALLAKGVNVNFKRSEPDDEASTALIGAGAGGNLEIVKLLLDAGADPSAQDSEGKTAYDWAKALAPKNVVKFLQEKTKAAQPAEEKQQRPTPPTGAKREPEAGKRQPYKEIRDIVKRFPEAAAKPAYQNLLRQLTDWSGQEPDPWRGTDSGLYRLRLKKKQLATLAAKLQLPAMTHDEDEEVEDYERLGEIVSRLQEEVRKQGFLLVQADLLGQNSAQLRLFPTDNPYAVIAATGTNGNGFITIKGEDVFLSARYIVAWLQRMEVDHPFVLTQCGKDFVGGDFLQPLTDAKKLARQMYHFCADIVDQGTGTVGALAKEIKEHQSFYLWWD